MAERMAIQQLNRLEEKFQRLKELDAGLSFFGAKEHRYVLNPPVPESVIAEFEGKYGVVIPTEYREFLLYVGDGGAGPYYGLYPLKYTYEQMGWIEPGDIRKPFPLDRRWNEQDYAEPGEYYDLPADADLHDGCIMLSHQGCAYWSFLVVSGKERGKVWDDFTSADGGMRPTGQDFLTWYEWWLDTGLRRELWF
jgi:hypothetical protein